ncbi:MAG: CBS domain-containing protein [Myxococcota bacterium]
MHVRDTMTPNPVSITAQETLQDAMELMMRKHIRHLPVVDAAGMLIGIVTDRDLRRASPSPLFGSKVDPQAAMETATVDRVMVRAPQTISPHQPLREAVQLFVDKKYGGLPVVENGRLVGIITPIDVMRMWLKNQG